MALDPNIEKYLDRLAGSKMRPSTYIFSGEDEDFKVKAAFYFISKISGKGGDKDFLDEAKSKSHPDVVVLEPEIEEKKGKIRERNIGISEVRDALERLRFFPYELKKKFCVIKKAEKMNVEASNALLKSLEEPSEKTVFILLAAGTDLVLPTILSRCAVLRFPKTDLPAWDEENRQKFLELRKAELHEKFEYVEKISKNKSELIRILADWEMVVAEGLRKIAGGDKRKISVATGLLGNIRESINRLEGSNASPRAVGENLMLVL